MAENDTQKMLKAVLVLQAEILGKLERLENLDKYQEIEALANGKELLGKPVPAYEDPRMEALHQIRTTVESGDNRYLDKAIDEVVGLINHPR